jgi:hypothetical protein
MARRRNPALEVLLAGRPAGAWVALDPQLSRVLGSGRTIEEALREVRSATNSFVLTLGQPPVILQIPDPSTSSYF